MPGKKLPLQLTAAHGKFGPREVRVVLDREADKMSGSKHINVLSDGCTQCREGAKMVVFLTGNCHYTCFYCPISEERRNRDHVFANERKLAHPDDVQALIEEAKATGAKGTGITGGDPMLHPERVMDYCRALKAEFGPDHHIHMYTQMTFTADVARKLKASGLDEVRFHPQPQLWATFEKTPYAEMLKRCREAGLWVGVEIPGLPDMEEQMFHMVQQVEQLGGMSFNVNELEFATINTPGLLNRGYALRNDATNRVKDSMESCSRLVTRAYQAGLKIPVHYCSSTFKDGVQLRNRLIRRAERTKKEHQVPTDDGTIVFGVVEGDEELLRAAHAKLVGDFEVPVTLALLTPAPKGNLRLEVAPWILEKFAPKLKVPAFLIEVYPTADQMEVERTPLA